MNDFNFVIYTQEKKSQTVHIIVITFQNYSNSQWTLASHFGRRISSLLYYTIVGEHFQNPTQISFAYCVLGNCPRFPLRLASVLSSSSFYLPSDKSDANSQGESITRQDKTQFAPAEGVRRSLIDEKKSFVTRNCVKRALTAWIL